LAARQKEYFPPRRIITYSFRLSVKRVTKGNSWGQGSDTPGASDTREAGAIPARSRHCDGEPPYENHWVLCPGRGKPAVNLSQETCPVPEPVTYEV